MLVYKQSMVTGALAHLGSPEDSFLSLCLEAFSGMRTGANRPYAPGNSYLGRSPHSLRINTQASLPCGKAIRGVFCAVN